MDCHTASIGSIEINPFLVISSDGEIVVKFKINKVSDKINVLKKVKFSGNWKLVMIIKLES